MIKAFSRLSRREKIIAYCVLGLISFLVFENLVLVPVGERLNTLNKEIVSQKKQLMRALGVLRQKEWIDQEYNQNVKPIKYSESDQEARAFLQKSIEELARETNLGISSLNFIETAKEEYRKYTVEVSAEATIVNFTNFLFQLERKPQLIRVSDFNISSARADPSRLEVSFSATKIIFPD